MIEAESSESGHKQPQKDDLVFLCAHVRAAATVHWYNFPEDLVVIAPGGAKIAGRWACLCEACHVRYQTGPNQHLAALVPLLGGHALWDGSEMTWKED